MKKMYKIIILIFIVIVFFVLYSRFISTKGLEIKEYKIENNKIPDSFYGVKIVHISDIHYGRTTKVKELKNMVDKINLLKPDIIVLTGDFFDNEKEIPKEEQRKIIEVLNRLNANIGKYAVSGNHDLYQSIWNDFITSCGFKNLNDTYEIIYNKSNEPIMISGLSSNLKNKLSTSDRIKESLEYINSLENPIYQILLIHEPDYITKFDYSKYDLILAGHSHGGQVRLPFIGAVPFVLPEGSKKYYESYYSLNNTDLFISSGIGCSTMNFRFLNKPSFNLYRIKK